MLQVGQWSRVATQVPCGLRPFHVSVASRREELLTPLSSGQPLGGSLETAEVLGKSRSSLCREIISFRLFATDPLAFQCLFLSFPHIFLDVLLPRKIAEVVFILVVIIQTEKRIKK